MYGNGDQATSMIVLKPQDSGLDTNLLITTDRRAYYLRLVSKPQEYVARVGFRYPEEENSQKWQQHLGDRRAQERDAKREVQILPAMVTAEKLNFGYKVTGGNEHIRPRRVYDDGAKTYIQMQPEMQNREAPALVVLGTDGKGEMTNYRVREQTYIVDRVFDRARLSSGLARRPRKWRLAVNPKDSHDQEDPSVKPMEGPAGLDLHPRPEQRVRVSKRAGLAIGLVVVGLLIAFAYGAYQRQQRVQAEAQAAGLPKAVAPATTAEREFIQAIPVNEPAATKQEGSNQLHPPGTLQPVGTNNGIPSVVGLWFRSAHQPAISVRSAHRAALCCLPDPGAHRGSTAATCAVHWPALAATADPSGTTKRRGISART